jgi:hypothetical protein
MLFFMLAMYLYERAKVVGAVDPGRAQSWYYASGVGFGLMLASKYAPYVFGFYATYNVAADHRPGANRPIPIPYNGLIVAAFVAANFTVLFPETWAYCLAYIQGSHSNHHGYLYDGTLYVNSAFMFLHGLPPTYYLHLLATKTPIPVLAAAVIGLIPLITRRRERGFVWLRVLIVIPLVGYSVLGAKFERYALQMLLMNDILAAVGLVTALGWVWRRSWPPAVRFGASALLCAGTVGVLAVEQWRAAPVYSIYQNAIGERLARPAETFPEEANDFGVREAVAAIAAEARPGAAIVSDVPMAVEYYLRRAGRGDLEARSLSGQGLRMSGEQWVLVQDSHTYFENAPVVVQLRQDGSPLQEYRLGGTPVLQVFRVDW